jgi:hypothetical protein
MKAPLRRRAQHHEVVAHQTTTDRHFAAPGSSPERPAVAQLHPGAREAQTGMGGQIRLAVRSPVTGQVGGTGDDSVAGAADPPGDQAGIGEVPGTDGHIEALRHQPPAFGHAPHILKLEEEKTVYLCNCGASANKPFCDGSHAQKSA